jgi:diadenosine tetraphosphate (Ap4A) HIT family hydrolase
MGSDKTLGNSMSCPFCSREACLENALSYARVDRFPVSPGHTLVIPKRHVETWFDMTPEEQKAAFRLVDQVKQYLDNEYTPDGYNIGINCGEAAGQSVAHAHIHIIPRYKNDMENPRGGVRGVIPEKQQY